MKRVYDPPEPDDGYRVMIDRVWPRGVSREQARIDQALETGRVSNVSMVQPATFVAKASSPRVRLTLLFGLFLASIASALAALAAEYLDPSLKTAEQAEYELGIPVLFSVPRGVGHELLPH